MHLVRITLALLVGGCSLQPGPGPSPSTTAPEPPAREAAFLPGFNYPDVHFAESNPRVLDVGGTIALKTGPGWSSASPPPFTWGVLETDRGRIDSEGRLTATAPGTLHVYAEVGAQRRYCAIAAVASPRDWWTIPVEGDPGFTTNLPAYATYLQSPEDWSEFWSAFTRPEQRPAAPDIDYAASTILAVTAPIHSIGAAHDVVLTHVDERPATLYHVTLTNWGQEVLLPAVSVLRGFFVLPKRQGAADVELSYPFDPPRTIPVSASRTPAPSAP